MFSSQMFRMLQEGNGASGVEVESDRTIARNTFRNLIFSRSRLLSRFLSLSVWRMAGFLPASNFTTWGYISTCQSAPRAHKHRSISVDTHMGKNVSASL